MLADLKAALVVTRREIRDQFRDWRILAPIVTLTIFFPGLMNFTAGQVVGFVEQYGAEIVGERLIPFLLMVVGFFPISISLVIALESFVGEKERRSIEPLLSSPISDLQLYAGKLLASLFLPVVASYLGIVVYLTGVYQNVGFRPPVYLLVQIILLTTVQAIVMVSAAVVISTQTTSTRAANLLASFIIIPMALLIQGESIIMFWGIYRVLWWVILALLLIAGLLIRSGLAHFNREELIGNEFDTLNIRWMGNVFRSGFTTGGDRFRWLREFFYNFRTTLGSPIIMVTLALVGAILIGVALSRQFAFPVEQLQGDSLRNGVVRGLEAMPIYSAGSVFTVWLHNLRALLLATLLGVFSFGVLGLLVVMFPLVIIGYFMAVMSGIGIAPWLFLSVFVAPHGIVEIPAIIVAGAAILRLSATLATPANGRSIGEAFILALTDWVKVLVLVVAPLLLVAALLEVYITPSVVALILGR